MAVLQHEPLGQAAGLLHSGLQLERRPGPGTFHIKIKILARLAEAQELVAHSSSHNAELQPLLTSQLLQPLQPEIAAAQEGAWGWLADLMCRHF